jgi:hypothetical protein
VVRGVVDGDHVSSVGQVIGADHVQPAIALVQDGDPAALRGHVEPVGGLVVGQDVGFLADGIGARGLPGAEVEGEQCGVGVAGDEAQPLARIQAQPVAVLAAG